MTKDTLEIHNKWNKGSPPRYPNCLLIQYTYRVYGQNIKKNSAVKVLDFGCGSGNNAMFLVENGFDTIAYDISEVALSNTNEKFDAFQKDYKKALIINDLSNIEDSSIDYVCSIDVFDCISFNEMKKALKEIFRITKKGGNIFFNFSSDKDYRTKKKTFPLHTCIDRSTLRNVLHSAEFTNIFLDKSTTTVNNNTLIEESWIVKASK